MRAGYGAHGSSRRTLPDGGHDPAFLERAAPGAGVPLRRSTSACALLGIENVPAEGPALLVANHSGGLPVRRRDADLRHLPRSPGPPARCARWWRTSSSARPGCRNVVARIGGVRASTETALPLLARGDLVGVFPEGLKGVGKMFRERYRLSRFGRGGFVRLARAGGRADHPGRDRRRRGDPPGAGQDHRAGRAAGHPLHPDHAHLSPRWAPSACCRCRPSGPSDSARRSRCLPADGRDDEADDDCDHRRAGAARRSTRMIADLLAQRRSIIFG